MCFVIGDVDDGREGCWSRKCTNKAHHLEKMKMKGMKATMTTSMDELCADNDGNDVVCDEGMNDVYECC